MFGIDFPELLVCLVVALVVLGPERLPEVVRTTSLWIGRFKRSLRATKEEIERQIGIDDIRRQLHTEEMMRTLDNMQDEIETALNYERNGNKSALENISTAKNLEPVTIEHGEILTIDAHNEQLKIKSV
jgi:sec-independent protein translocase protein TatB